MLKNRHRFDFRKQLKLLFKRMIIPMITIMLFVLIIKGILDESAIKAFSINTEEGFFWLLSKMSQSTILCFDFLWLLFIVAVIILIVGLFNFFKDHYKNKLLILKHNSLNAMSFKIDESELDEYSIEEFAINQFRVMEDTKINLKEKISVAIKDQLSSIEQIRGKIDNGYDLAYIGIAHSPLIFLLGYMIGDENGVKLFHKRRDDSSEDMFHILPSINYSEKFSRKPERIATTDFDTLILCIETTFEISDAHIQSIRTNTDFVIRYSTANKGFDVLYSAKQIDEYVSIVKTDLKNIFQQANIKKIKICISSSAAFTFALARSFSPHHDPEIEVYHYDVKKETKYPWGINITRKEAILR